MPIAASRAKFGSFPCDIRSRVSEKSRPSKPSTMIRGEAAGHLVPHAAPPASDSATRMAQAALCHLIEVARGAGPPTKLRRASPEPWRRRDGLTASRFARAGRVGSGLLLQSTLSNFAPRTFAPAPSHPPSCQSGQRPPVHIGGRLDPEQSQSGGRDVDERRILTVRVTIAEEHARDEARIDAVIAAPGLHVVLIKTAPATMPRAPSHDARYPAL